MLLDEDPATLIHECISNFNIYPDRAALSRISESLAALHTARSLRLREASSALKKLSRTHNTLSQQHSLSVSSHNPTEHATHILALDTQKFKVAKEASDLEIESERLEQELQGLETVLNDLEIQYNCRNPTSIGGANEDQAILKLKVYHSLGMDIEVNTTGNYDRAILRSLQNGDVHVIDIASSRPREHYAKMIWEHL